MEVLTAAVVLVGVVALLNLVLTMGVIRRLRDHTDRLAAVPPGGRPARPVLPPGATIGEFATTDVDGRPLSRDQLTGSAVVGFFTPGCDSCRDLVPRYATKVAEQGWQALAVMVVERGEDWSAYRRFLDPVARTVVEPPDGPVQRAFEVAGFPAIAVVGADHTVIASGVDATPLDQVTDRPAAAGSVPPRT